MHGRHHDSRAVHSGLYDGRVSRLPGRAIVKRCSLATARAAFKCHTSVMQVNEITAQWLCCFCGHRNEASGALAIQDLQARRARQVAQVVKLPRGNHSLDGAGAPAP